MLPATGGGAALLMGLAAIVVAFGIGAVAVGRRRTLLVVIALAIIPSLASAEDVSAASTCPPEVATPPPDPTSSEAVATSTTTTTTATTSPPPASVPPSTIAATTASTSTTTTAAAPVLWNVLPDEVTLERGESATINLLDNDERGSEPFTIELEGGRQLDSPFSVADINVTVQADGTTTIAVGASAPQGAAVGIGFYGVRNAAGLDAGAQILVRVVAPPPSTSGPNQGPVAIDDSAFIFENDVFVDGLALSNDSDPDGDALVVTNTGIFTLAYGQMLINPAGVFVYSPDNANPVVNALNDGDVLADSLTYTVSDGRGGTATATITVTVSGVTD